LGGEKILGSWKL